MSVLLYDFFHLVTPTYCYVYIGVIKLLFNSRGQRHKATDSHSSVARTAAGAVALVVLWLRLAHA